MKKTICILILTLFFLSGCRSEDPAQSVSRVVTDITVTCDNGSIQTQRYYTSSVKMRAILNYLRWIDPYGIPAEDPERIGGSLFRIVMKFSDGSQKVYLQKADRYMQIDGKDWMTIDAEKALTLSKMLGEMESDTA